MSKLDKIYETKKVAHGYEIIHRDSIKEVEKDLTNFIKEKFQHKNSKPYVGIRIINKHNSTDISHIEFTVDMNVEFKMSNELGLLVDRIFLLGLSRVLEVKLDDILVTSLSEDKLVFIIKNKDGDKE